MRFQIETTHSPDDGGWYAEVFERATGKTVYTTEIHPTERDARKDAENAALTEEANQ